MKRPIRTKVILTTLFLVASLSAFIYINVATFDMPEQQRQKIEAQDMVEEEDKDTKMVIPAVAIVKKVVDVLKTTLPRS